MAGGLLLYHSFRSTSHQGLGIRTGPHSCRVVCLCFPAALLSRFPGRLDQLNYLSASCSSRVLINYRTDTRYFILKSFNDINVRKSMEDVSRQNPPFHLLQASETHPCNILSTAIYFGRILVSFLLNLAFRVFGQRKCKTLRLCPAPLRRARTSSCSSPSTSRGLSRAT